MSRAKFQEAIQRFTSDYMFRVAQAAGPLEAHESPELRQLALRRVLIYHSTALDIATGPYPELNVVDMLVFASLSRSAFERHWLPRVFGEPGRSMLETLADAERELWTLADQFLAPEQHREIEHLLDEWTRMHPDQYLVEGVRFAQFSSRAGEVSEARAAKASGLFGQLRSATQAADQALLISERAFFLAHRLPFLLRLQVRIGAQELFSDSLATAEQLGVLLDDAERRVDRMTRRGVASLLVLGLGWAASLWGGYYAVKRLTA